MIETINANCLDVLKETAANSQDLIFCDPPYALGSDVIIRKDGKPDYRKAVDFVGTVIAFGVDAATQIDQGGMFPVGRFLLRHPPVPDHGQHRDQIAQKSQLEENPPAALGALFFQCGKGKLFKELPLPLRVFVFRVIQGMSSSEVKCQNQRREVYRQTPAALCRNRRFRRFHAARLTILQRY